MTHEDVTQPRPDQKTGPNPQAGTGTTKPTKKQESWLEVVKTIVYALLIAGVIRSFLFQPFNIPSGSMEATLLVGDYLFVSKSAYGYSRYSFPFAAIPFSGRFFTSEPTRGDVVVFKFPGDNKTDYIKRLIGLPGDRIQMKEGVLYINDRAIPKVKVEDYIEEFAGTERHIPQYRETLPNGVSYTVLDRNESSLDDTDVFVVPEGHYFMMGDNRDNSDDSRADVGYVPFENFVGKAEIIFFSSGCKLFNNPGVADERPQCSLFGWPLDIRYGRVGKFVN
jgi:signal peptidase I